MPVFSKTDINHGHVIDSLQMSRLASAQRAGHVTPQGEVSPRTVNWNCKSSPDGSIRALDNRSGLPVTLPGSSSLCQLLIEDGSSSPELALSISARKGCSFSQGGVLIATFCRFAENVSSHWCGWSQQAPADPGEASLSEKKHIQDVTGTLQEMSLGEQSVRGLGFALPRLQSVVGVLLENLDNRDPKEKIPKFLLL